MPNYDGTGPQGQGPMSGGGFGRCAAGQDSSMQGQGRGGSGRGQGGAGRGLGFCSRLGRAFGFGRFGRNRQDGGLFRFGRFPRTSDTAAGQDPAQARIADLEREVAELKAQLKSR